MVKHFVIDNISPDHNTALDAVNHAVDWMESLLVKPSYSVRGSSKLFHLMRRDLPYRMHAMNLPNTRILVNREYKPVGCPKNNDVVYEEYTNIHICLSNDQINQIRLPGTADALFDDGSAPWDGKIKAKSYMRRLLDLQSLLKHQ